MAVGSGIGGQFSCGEESTFGTAASMGRHLRLLSYEIVPEKEVQSVWGVAAGRAAPIDEVVTKQWGTVKVTLQANKRGLGMLLRQIFGGTVAPVQQAATTAYLQALTVADPRGRMLSMQGGFPNTAGTVSGFTALGAKCTKFSIKCSQGEIAVIEMEFDAREVSEVPSLTTWADTSQSSPFSWKDLTVKLHSTFGSEATVQGVRGITLDLERPTDLDGSFYAGNATRRSEPNWNDHFVVSGSIDIDFVTKADFVDRMTAHTSTALNIEFVGDIIATIYPETLTFRVPKAKFGVFGLSVPDNGVLKASVPFNGLLDTTNGLALCNYISLDTAV